MAICASDKPTMATIKAELSKYVTITDLGEIRFFLGLHIDRDRTQHSINLHQSSYIRTVIERFQLNDATPTTTPLDSSIKLLPATPDHDPHSMDKIPYATAIGSLMYVAVSTRPDISFSV